MNAIPTVQIRQQYARIGIDRQPSKLEIVQQPPPVLEHQTVAAKLEIQNALQSPPGRMEIDQSRAREALGIGSTFAFVNRVADEASRLAMEGVAKIVEKGNRIGDLRNKGNVIAEMAAESFFEDQKVNYEGPFEADNVDIHFTATPPSIQYTPAEKKFTAHLHTPEINFTPAQISVYLAQKPSVEWIPPQIDLKV